MKKQVDKNERGIFFNRVFMLLIVFAIGLILIEAHYYRAHSLQECENRLMQKLMEQDYWATNKNVHNSRQR